MCAYKSDVCVYVCAGVGIEERRRILSAKMLYLRESTCANPSA